MAAPAPFDWRTAELALHCVRCVPGTRRIVARCCRWRCVVLPALPAWWLAALHSNPHTRTAPRCCAHAHTLAGPSAACPGRTQSRR
jgi:hypothetical protein